MKIFHKNDIEEIEMIRHIIVFDLKKMFNYKVTI